MARILRGCRYRGIEGLEECDPNSKDRNRFAVNILRPYFSVPPSCDIHIDGQSEQKNPIHNPIHLRLNFQPRRVYIPSGMRLTGNAQNLFGIFRGTCELNRLHRNFKSILAQRRKGTKNSLFSPQRTRRAQSKNRSQRITTGISAVIR